jgi:hypothetical protein
VSLLAASPPFSSIKLLRNCPIFFNNVSKTKFTNIIIKYYIIITLIYNIIIITIRNFYSSPI